jgi:hypothetical protein
MPTTFSLDEAVEDSPAAVTPPQTFGLDEAVTEPAPKLTILPSSPLNLDVPPQGKIPEPTELPSLAGGVPPLPPEPTKFQQAETGISDFLGETAKDTAAVASDIVTAATLKKFGKDEAAFKPEWNIPAMITGDEKLPYQKTIDDITKSDPYKAIVAQTAEDIIGTAPQLLIGGVGLPKLALRVLSGVFTYLLFKNEKPIADALGDYYGKNPEDRDPKQGRDLWAKAIENTGFATLTGYGTAQPGIAKEIPTLKSYLTKEVVESYPPGQLKDVFVRVGNDVADAYAASNEGRPVAPQQSTPEEKNLYNFIASGVSDLPTAVKGGAKVTDTTPRLTRDWLNKYLGIETTPTRTLSVNEQPPASPTISQPVQQLANGEQNAPNQIIQQESASQELSRPETRQAVSPDTGQIRQGAGSVPDGSGSLESGTTPVAPPPSPPAVVPPVEVKPTVTANQILSRPQGTTSPEELASLPDSELQKLTEAAQKGQYPMTVDATKWAISNPQADIPQLESMRQVMLKRGTYASFSQWYADAIHTLQGDEVGKMNIATVTGKQSPQPEVEAKPAPVTESVATPTSAAKPPAPEQSVQGNQVEAKAYIDSIKKNPSKQAYAQAYLDWVNGGKQGAEPTPPETLKESFSKAVRLTVDESLAREAEPTPPPSPTGAKSAQVAIIPEGMSLNPVEHGFDSVEQFQSDFEKLSIKEDADTFAETKDEFLKRKHCRSLEGTPIKRAMRKKT